VFPPTGERYGQGAMHSTEFFLNCFKMGYSLFKKFLSSGKWDIAQCPPTKYATECKLGGPSVQLQVDTIAHVSSFGSRKRCTLNAKVLSHRIGHDTMRLGAPCGAERHGAAPPSRVAVFTHWTFQFSVHCIACAAPLQRAIPCQIWREITFSRLSYKYRW